MNESDVRRKHLQQVFFPQVIAFVGCMAICLFVSQISGIKEFIFLVLFQIILYYPVGKIVGKIYEKKSAE